MVSQHAGAWIFVAAFCAVAFVVVVLVALAPVKERQIRLLFIMGVGTGLLAIAYLVLVSLLPGATLKVPHTGPWAPEVVQSIAPTLGVVAVGSLSVWAALLTTERTRLSSFDWSEAEIFGAARTALAAIDAAVEPFHQFLLTTGAAAGWDMLVSAWKDQNQEPRLLGSETPRANTAVEAAFAAEHREMLARAARSAEMALGNLTAAQARIGRPLQLAGSGSTKLASLDGDVALLRDLLTWVGREEKTEADKTINRSRIVFLLARAASTGPLTGINQPPPATADPGRMRRVRPAWLADLLDRLEPFRPPGALPPLTPDGETKNLRLVADQWDSMERSRLARAKLIARLDALDPARHPSRPFSAPTHERLWSQVFDGWQSDMRVLAGAEPEPEDQTPPCATYLALLPVAHAFFTLTVPAPDSELTEQAKAAGMPGSRLLAGQVKILNSWIRETGGKDAYPNEVWPVEVYLWTVDHDARWHLASLVADEINKLGEHLDPDSPLDRSLTGASRDTPQETLWVSPLPLPQVRWWVASYESRSGKFYPSHDERRRELRLHKPDQPDSRDE